MCARTALAELAETEPQPMAAGEQEVSFHIDEMGVEGISKHVLVNLGLLKCDLYAYSPPQEIVSIGMVTQVSEEGDPPILTRHIFNPIE